MQTDLFAALDWRDALEQLRDQGLLRDLDVAVARFLRQQCPEAGNEVLLLAAFTSHQQASSHLCLDLNNRELATQLWGGNPPTALTALLPGTVDDWLRHLQHSPLVSEPGGADAGGTHSASTPLVLDGVLRGRLRRSGPLWLTAVVVFVLGEGWLWSIYGRVHLIEVLTRAGEIPRGALWGRLLGVLTRLCLVGPVLLALLPPGRRLIGLPGVLLAGLVFFLARPAAMPQQVGAMLLMVIMA